MRRQQSGPTAINVSSSVLCTDELHLHRSTVNFQHSGGRSYRQGHDTPRICWRSCCNFSWLTGFGFTFLKSGLPATIGLGMLHFICKVARRSAWSSRDALQARGLNVLSACCLRLFPVVAVVVLIILCLTLCSMRAELLCQRFQLQSTLIANSTPRLFSQSFLLQISNSTEQKAAWKWVRWL